MRPIHVVYMFVCNVYIYIYREREGERNWELHNWDYGLLSAFYLITRRTWVLSKGLYGNMLQLFILYPFLVFVRAPQMSTTTGKRFNILGRPQIAWIRNKEHDSPCVVPSSLRPYACSMTFWFDHGVDLEQHEVPVFDCTICEGLHEGIRVGFHKVFYSLLLEVLRFSSSSDTLCMRRPLQDPRTCFIRLAEKQSSHPRHRRTAVSQVALEVRIRLPDQQISKIDHQVCHTNLRKSYETHHKPSPKLEAPSLY